MSKNLYNTYVDNKNRLLKINDVSREILNHIGISLLDVTICCNTRVNIIEYINDVDDVIMVKLDDQYENITELHTRQLNVEDSSVEYALLYGYEILDNIDFSKITDVLPNVISHFKRNISWIISIICI